MFIVFGKKAFYAIFALLLVLTAATVSMLLPPEAVETSVSAPIGPLNRAPIERITRVLRR